MSLSQNQKPYGNDLLCLYMKKVITAIIVVFCIFVILILFRIFANFSEGEDKPKLNEIKENLLEQIKWLFCWDQIMGLIGFILFVFAIIYFFLSDKGVSGA